MTGGRPIGAPINLKIGPMSAFGTKRTRAGALHMSAIGGKADPFRRKPESRVSRALLAMFTVIGGGVFRALGYSLGYAVQGSRRFDHVLR